jgi:phospholipid/cholesterol/gamma-HCH transport system ATP-binding protein
MAVAGHGTSGGMTRADIRTEMLSFENVTVGYGGPPILEGLSFDLRRGEVAGVVALDARGRSTLIKCAAGLLAPESGTVAYEGQDIYRMSFGEDQRFRTRSAVVLEGGALFANRSIFSNVALPLRYHLGGSEESSADYVRRLLDRVGYNEDPNALPWQVSARGRRLAAFARALVREPELVLVDRFFEALDVADWKRLMELVLEMNVKSGTSFLLVGELHPTIFQVAERVLVLDHGKKAGHDFKRALFKDERIKKAFETADDLQHAPRPVDPEPPVQPLEVGGASDGFDPNESDSGELVVVIEEKKRPPTRPKPPSRIAKALPRSQQRTDDGETAAEATVNMPAEAAAAVIAAARARNEQRLEDEARATEAGSASGVRSIEPSSQGGAHAPPAAPETAPTNDAPPEPEEH